MATIKSLKAEVLSNSHFSEQVAKELKLKTSALKLLMVADEHYQLI